MRVIQCYQSILDYREGGPVRFEKYPFHEFCLIASALSWKKFAPEFERVFYVDQSIFEYLKRKGIEDLWDRVEVVKFPKSEGYTYYMCKEYCFTLQNQPFWISDTDVILSRPLVEWFNPDFNFIPFYDNLNIGNNKEMYVQLLQDYPKLADLVDPSRSGCAGLIYFRNAEQARTLGSKIVETLQWWVKVKDQGRNLQKYKNLHVGILIEEGMPIKYLEDDCHEQVDYHTLYENTHIHTFLGATGREITPKILKTVEKVQDVLDCDIIGDYGVQIKLKPRKLV